jgi:hypothetical protein
MRIYEVLPELTYLFTEDADALCKAANTSMHAARRQKKSAQIQKTKDRLSDQQRQLTTITNSENRE